MFEQTRGVDVHFNHEASCSWISSAIICPGRAHAIVQSICRHTGDLQGAAVCRQIFSRARAALAPQHKVLSTHQTGSLGRQS